MSVTLLTRRRWPLAPPGLAPRGFDAAGHKSPVRKRGVRLLRKFAGFSSALLLASSMFATTYHFTIAGLGGEPDYEVRFAQLAGEATKLITATPDAKTFMLAGSQATKAQIREIMGTIAQQAKPDDTVVVLLIGHGAFDGQDYKINIPGPDLTAVELDALMDRVPAQRQLVVNTTSAGGASIAVLQKQNRVVISATKSGTERNAPVFARFWVEALRDPSADSDKNEAVSALEAYRYADQKTTAYYERAKRLATEHAMLEDTGKGEGVRAPSQDNGQGLLAGRFTVLRLGAMQKAAGDPAKQELLRRKEDLEQKIDQLKYNKAALPAAEYSKQLRQLLLDLARLQTEIDK
jgi:hypothetical protein